MKLSNLALRLEPDTGRQPAETAAETAPLEELARAARRLQRIRRLGLDYRSIVIRDDGLRPFRVR